MRLALVILLVIASPRGARSADAGAMALVRSSGRVSVLLGEPGGGGGFTRVVVRHRDGRWVDAAPMPALRGAPFMLRNVLWTATGLEEHGGRHAYLLASSEQAEQSAHRVDPALNAVAWAVAPVDEWTLLLVEQLADGQLVAQRIVAEGAAEELQVAQAFGAGSWPADSRLMDVDATPSGRFVSGGLTAAGRPIATIVDDGGAATTIEPAAPRATGLAVAHAGASPMIFAVGAEALAAIRLDGRSASEPMTVALDPGDVAISLQACSLPGDRALAVALVRGASGERLLAITSDGRELLREARVPEPRPGAASAPAASARERIAAEERADRLRARVVGGVVVAGLLLALFVLMARLAALRR